MVLYIYGLFILQFKNEYSCLNVVCRIMDIKLFVYKCFGKVSVPAEENVKLGNVNSVDV